MDNFPGKFDSQHPRHLLNGGNWPGQAADTLHPHKYPFRFQFQINCYNSSQRFLLNWVPGVGAAPGSDDAHAVSPTAVHFEGANMAQMLPGVTRYCQVWPGMVQEVDDGRRDDAAVLL